MKNNYFEGIAGEWRDRSSKLAQWSMQRLVNRTDVWGRYVTKRYRDSESGSRNHAITSPFRDERGKVFLNEASREKHFKTRLVGGVLGLHSASSDLTSRWLAIDIDLHDECDLSTTREGNFVAARRWYERLRQLGMDPLLLDSNGKGGIHLLCIFAEPICTRSISSFATELVNDYRQDVLHVAPELFPGRPKWHSYGDWLRLFGRHHTLNHYTRIYNEQQWEAQCGWREMQPLITSWRLAPPHRPPVKQPALNDSGELFTLPGLNLKTRFDSGTVKVCPSGMVLQIR